jgi:hypothetical protein
MNPLCHLGRLPLRTKEKICCFYFVWVSVRIFLVQPADSHITSRPHFPYTRTMERLLYYYQYFQTIITVLSGDDCQCNKVINATALRSTYLQPPPTPKELANVWTVKTILSNCETGRSKRWFRYMTFI